MANMIYMTLNGAKQGLISEGCSSPFSIGNKHQLSHINQIQILCCRHEMTRDQNVNHHPIIITKPIDKSSPLLGVAISENESLTCTLDFYRTNENGMQEKYYTIILNKASIVSIYIDYPHALNHNDIQPEESIAIRYADINWFHHIAGTSGYSLWEERVW
ncbi:Hcp family type VI secretion system effector [Obesumbacterium proteus]|uniref:Hcp family type VI secretion system effector n=1 Tax=Obesumbacterium proteus TaxID=82983 RepID=UPI002431CAE2|nr:Hcp family type VI secretion system effector [Obesumbacterium proteus]